MLFVLPKIPAPAGIRRKEGEMKNGKFSGSVESDRSAADGMGLGDSADCAAVGGRDPAFCPNAFSAAASTSACAEIHGSK